MCHLPHHSRLRSYRDCYSQFPNKRIRSSLAPFPERLISLCVLEKLRFVFGPCFCSLWCGSRLFPWLWYRPTAKAWPSLVAWCMRISVPKSHPLLGVRLCWHGLSPHAVPLWALKWWLVCIPVLGIRRGLLPHFVLQLPGGYRRGTGRDPSLHGRSAIRHPTGWWISLCSCSCLILVKEEACSPSIMVNLCLEWFT